MSYNSTVRLERKEVSCPSPGDGICPTNAQSDHISRASFDLWNLLRLETKGNLDPILIVDKLLSLLQQVPGLVAHPSQGFTIKDSGCPFLQFALDCVTTTDQVCEQPTKRTIHYQLLGIPEPRRFEFTEGLEAWSPWLGTQVEWGHFSFLILAWTYILSSRWVETLRMAGEEAYMKLSKEGSVKVFWELVVEQHWQASIVRGETTFYAPWSLVRLAIPQLACQVQASPDSSYTFKSLVNFCVENKIDAESVAAALAVVLMIPQSTVEIKLPPISATPVKFNTTYSLESWRDSIKESKKDCYDKMFECLNQCITMSCTLEGISSLLCSVLFDPAVPCNLIGAHLCGITKAIEPIKGNAETLFRLMARKSPSTSPFWLAAVWTGQSSEILSSALAGMPPLSLPMASWTEAPQSFLQLEYRAITHRAEFITRAREFQILYYINPSAPMPFAPSPPFGETAVSGTSLEIRAHLSHKHLPIQHKTYWVLDTEDVLLAQSKDMITRHPIVSLPSIPSVSHFGTDEPTCRSEVIDTADRISSDVTLNLFNWCRELEGGLWLEETKEAHPWIIYESDEHYSSQSEDSPTGRDNFDRIEGWQDEVLI